MPTPFYSESDGSSLVRSIAAIARAGEGYAKDEAIYCKACAYQSSRKEHDKCPQCGLAYPERLDVGEMAVAVRVIAKAYAKNPEQVNLALLEAARGAINAKLYHDRIAHMRIEHERRVADESELGTFFRLQFQREIEQGMHAGKSTNEVIMAYLWKYYLRKRDSWWGRTVSWIFGSGWGI